MPNPIVKTKPKPECDHGHAGLRRGHEMEDSASSANWGVRMRSAYLSIVGDSPRLKPDDRRNASRHLARVETAIEKGGWTRGEWRRLYEMRRKWSARANGQDERFKLYGTLQGGLTRHQQNEVDLHRTINRVKGSLGGVE